MQLKPRVREALGTNAFPLRIAQVAPLFESVPPQLYGGTERVVYNLTEALVDLGHDVTLFATGESKTRATLVAPLDHSLRLAGYGLDPMAYHLVMLDQLMASSA